MSLNRSGPAPETRGSVRRMDDETGGDGLRERLTRQGEDALGKLAQDLLENPLVNGAIARAFEAREKAAQAQEVAFGALNIPSAADIERLTRRVRSVSQRLEGIEDGVDRLDERLAGLQGLRSTRSPRSSPRCARPRPSGRRPSAGRRKPPPTPALSRQHRRSGASAGSAPRAQALGHVLGLDRALDRHQAGGGDARPARRRPAPRRSRGRRRARPRPASACSTSADAITPATVAAQRRGEPGVGLDARARAERAAGAVGREHRRGGHELAGAQRAVERPRAADAHRASQARARAARRRRWPRSARRCRCSGPSAARRRARCPCSPRARGGG